MTANRSSRLGRGLAALIGDTDPSVTPLTPQAPTGGGQKTLPIGQLRRNPDQPRKRFEDAELSELVASVKEKGILQPLLVRPIPGDAGEPAYQIVAGERRWRAAQKAGLHDLPVVVKELSDREVLEIGIIENVQRADLNAIEEARGYQALIDQFGHTQEGVAQVVGKSRSHVANLIRLLKLPKRVQDLIYDSQLTAGHARAIANCPDPEIIARRVVEQKLSVRETEALARKVQAQGNGGRSGATETATKSTDTEALEKEVMTALGLQVDIRDASGKGEIRIKYATLEQLEDVCARLTGTR